LKFLSDLRSHFKFIAPIFKILLLMEIQPSRRTSYWSFGYVPKGKKGDLLRRFLGEPNILKRVQAPAILKALDLNENEKVCDLGCGLGYITIELAKQCSYAIGVDINPSIALNRIPSILSDRLKFVVQDARELPLDTASVDAVLCSEVLMMIPDPLEFLVEIRRVLKPGGRIVAVNGLGHYHISKAFERNSITIQLLRAVFKDRVPLTYESYYAQLQAHFGTAIQPKSHMFYPRLFESVGFEVVDISYSPSSLCACYLSWLQFVQFIRTGRGVTDFSYLRFLIASLLNNFGGSGTPTGQIIKAITHDTLL